MIRVEWVEVADGVGDGTSNLVSQALDGLSLDAARGGHYLLDLDAAERLERELWAALRPRGPGSGFGRRLEAGLRRWLWEPAAARPRLAAAAAVAAAAAAAWLWRSGAFDRDDDEAAEVDEEARCPICLEREVGAARGDRFGDFYFLELCCRCGAACCEPCARSVARHAKRAGAAPLCALCRGELAAPSAERHLSLLHLVAKRPAGVHVAAARYELGSMRARGDGCVQDARVAADHLVDAARRGHARAAYALSAAYAEARGRPRDEGLSRSWLRRAARRGCADARAALDEADRAGASVVCFYDGWCAADGYAASAADLWLDGGSSGADVWTVWPDDDDDDGVF